VGGWRGPTGHKWRWGTGVTASASLGAVLVLCQTRRRRFASRLALAGTGRGEAAGSVRLLGVQGIMEESVPRGVDQGKAVRFQF
jgi:hypothetical protein